MTIAQRTVSYIAATVCAALFLLVPVTASGQSTIEMVQMPDGVLLETERWVPAGSGPWPVVLIRTRYERSEADAQFFVDHGYAVVIQSTRGNYQSGGQFWLHYNERDDGHATIDWVSQQSWCDGNIGMIGLSALGLAQYAVAEGANPALKCLAPERATADAYHILTFQGGALRYAFIYNVCENNNLLDLYDEILLHRLWGDWWHPWEWMGEPGNAHVPMLHIGGWYDVMQQGTLDAFHGFQHSGGVGAAGNQYLLMDPLDHFYRYGALPLPPDMFPDGDDQYYPQHRLAWLDHCLKGDSSGIDEWPQARVYLMGACEEAGSPGCLWVDLDEWPPPHRVQQLFLSASGGLSPGVPDAGEIELLMDPNDPVPTRGGANNYISRGPNDQRPVEQRDDVLVFSTEVLAQPVHVMGRVTARIWIRPDTPDLDLSVRLTDVYPDGRSMLVVDGIQRARMRESDEYETFLPIGVPIEIEVDLWSTAMVFNAGHRIRVAIAGTNWTRFEVNPNDGGDLNDPNPIVAHPDILFGPDHPSSIELPIPFVLPFWEDFESGDLTAWSTVVP